MTDMSMWKESDLRGYQRRFVGLILRLASVIFTLPMGAGKTIIVLTAIKVLLARGLIRKALIVAPKNVALVTWPDEFDEWEHLQDLSWSLLRIDDEDERLRKCRQSNYRFARDVIGLETKEAQAFASRRETQYKEWLRQGAALEDTQIHIINKDALVWLWWFFGEGKDWPYDMIVYDESSMFKNAKSRRTDRGMLTQYMVAKRIRKKVKRTVLLTGTIAPKGLINLFGQVFIADGGKRLGTSKTAYEKRYFETSYDGFKLVPHDWSFGKILAKIKDIAFGMREEDCVTLPPRIDNIIKVDIGRKNLDRYEKFKKTMIETETDIEAVNRGVLTLKLLQFANGSIYDEHGKDQWVHDAKLEALETIIEEANGLPVLVAYTFEFDKRRIKKKFGKRVEVWGEGSTIRSQKKRWNEGKIDILIAHPASIGHGQNIQKGGNILVWYGLTNDLEHYQQMNKRLHRSGQDADAVFVHHIIAKNTRDERTLEVLNERGATQDTINEALLIDLVPDDY